MRKIISLSVGVALAATVFAAIPAAAESATVTRGGDCGMPGFDADGELVGQERLGTVKKLVVNDNHALMTCKGTEMVNEYGRTHVASGFGCMIFFPDETMEMTFDSWVKITKDGNATMRCSLPIEQAEDDDEEVEGEEE